MSGMELNRAQTFEAAGSPGKWVYTVGQVAVWIELLIFRRWLGGEFLLFRSIGIIPVGPKAVPVKAIDWFNFLHANPVLGLAFLNGFDMVNFVLAGVVFLVLYGVLKRSNQGSMILAVVFMLIVRSWSTSRRTRSAHACAQWAVRCGDHGCATINDSLCRTVGADEQEPRLNRPESGLRFFPCSRFDCLHGHAAHRHFQQENRVFRDAVQRFRFGLPRGNRLIAGKPSKPTPAIRL